MTCRTIGAINGTEVKLFQRIRLGDECNHGDPIIKQCTQYLRLQRIADGKEDDLSTGTADVRAKCCQVAGRLGWQVADSNRNRMPLSLQFIQPDHLIQPPFSKDPDTVAKLAHLVQLMRTEEDRVPRFA